MDTKWEFNVVLQETKRFAKGNYITCCSECTEDQLCNEVLNMNSKYERLTRKLGPKELKFNYAHK